jgi:hypothetical protein
MKIYPDTYDEFVDWFHNNFLKRNGGFAPNNLRSWYDLVIKEHSSLTKMFGSFRFQREYTLKQHQNIVSLSEAKVTINRIKELFPQYLPHYGYTDEIFLQPIIQSSHHTVIKTGKHILSFARNFRSDYGYDARFAELEKCVSQLGELWARYRTSDVKLEATISCSPKSFVLLGHYGPDHDSCFRQGSSSQRDKYSLAQSTNTFIVTISRKHKNKDKNINIGRFIGFYSAMDNTFNFINYYYSELKDGDAVEVLRLLSQELLKTEPKVLEDIIVIDRGVHFNRNGINLSFSYSSNIGPQVLRPNCHGISVFLCPRCHQKFDDDRRWTNVDNLFVCLECSYKAHICQISQIKTFQNLVEYHKNANILMIHPDEAKKLQQCQNCEVYFDRLDDINNTKLCEACVQEKFIFCDTCNKPIEDNMIIDIGDMSICQSCMADQEKFNLALSEIDDMQGELECFQTTRLPQLQNG